MKNKKHSVLSNMLYCVRCTADFLPSLLWWTGFTVLVTVSIPILEMYLPKLVLSELSGETTPIRLIIIVLAATLSLAVLMGFDKLCNKTVYFKKISMGSYYIHAVAQKGLVTDYSNIENEKFRELQRESYNLCSINESLLRNVYFTWISFFSGVLGFIFYTLLLTGLNIIIFLFLIASTVLNYFISQAVTKWTDENSAEKTGYHHKLGYIDSSAEDIKSAKDIRIYKMEPWLQGIYRDNIEKIAKWYKRYDKVVSKTTVGNSSISLVREGTGYAYLIYLAFIGQIDAGDFVLYFAAITGFSAWLQSIMSEVVAMKRASIHITKFRNYLVFENSFKREEGLHLKTEGPCDIELKNVTFKYGQNIVLDNINLKIKSGEHVGIVGLNGAGKTTLIKLICGLLDPTGGEVLYNGINVKEYNRLLYYTAFSTVFQQHSLLPLSIAQAVAGDEINSHRVVEVLKAAGLWERISSLPMGIQTPLDLSINENATSFSGGETQKLLLARALYKDAPVLVLDEPTAALDPIAEHELYENYHGMTAGKTGMFISHRLASTRFCERILLIDKGKILEDGTHSQLLSNGGLYCNLFETQAKYYREEVSQHEEVL